MANADKGAAFLDQSAQRRPSVADSYDVIPQLLDVYKNGFGHGDSTGWRTLNQFYTVAPGQITTITGYPNSGKSQFTDALALNLAKQGWRFCFCSLENLPVVLHVEKLIRQYIGKPTREGPNPRMSEDELQEAAVDMADWFKFIVPSEIKPNPSLLDVMVAIEENFTQRELWRLPGGKLAAVIDPWNELEHFRPQGMMLTEYIGESLSRLRQWTRTNMLHLFIVAHPAKQLRHRDSAKLPVVTPDMISDSAHFWNKSDNCITVAQQEEPDTHKVDIHVQKVRFSHIGRRGVVTLNYDKISGRYVDPNIIQAVR